MTEGRTAQRILDELEAAGAEHGELPMLFSFCACGEIGQHLHSSANQRPHQTRTIAITGEAV